MEYIRVRCAYKYRKISSDKSLRNHVRKPSFLCYIYTGWDRAHHAMDMKDEVRLPVPASKLFKWNVAMSVFHTTFAVLVLAAGKIDLKMPMCALLAPAPPPRAFLNRHASSPVCLGGTATDRKLALWCLPTHPTMKTGGEPCLSCPAVLGGCT